ncbi:hypothetical protein [Shewanella glacialipiscicola]|uniref:hypothetical protein n=1 Tax=Shewanella glacialipiscicola TaxID=614069 RepID=UPI003D7B018E
MGLPVTVYRHTDAGAPQLTSGTPSQWIDILKKVLVDGYGSKLPLGWTLEFENAGQYKVAFRNKIADGGTGGYVQFWSSTGGNPADASMNFQCAQSMTALDTFTRPGYGRQINSASWLRGWEIIGTSRGFYLSIYQTNVTTVGFTDTGSKVYFIGDIAPQLIGDIGVFTIVSTVNAGDTYSASSQGITYGSDSVYCRLYAADGSNSSYVYNCPKINYSTLSLDGNAESLGINHVMRPFTLLGLSTTLDANGIVQNNSMVMPYCRGVVPGLYMSSFGGYRSETWPKELVLSGVTWVLIPSRWYTGYWIKTGEWYD